MKKFKAYCNTESRVQEYGCGVSLLTLDGLDYIFVDGCLWQELQFLWKHRIKTVGCCCGHHINSQPNSAYIQVTEDCIDKMKSMGYRRMDKVDCFIPKTEIIKESNE